MKNKLINLRYVYLIIVGFWVNASIAVQSSEKTVMDSAKYLLAHQQYTSSRQILQDYLKKNPSSNEALYLSVAVEQTRILDFESYLIDGNRFIILADSARSVLESRITRLQGQDSIKCLYYIGNIYGGISVMQAKSGNWFDGVKNALNSVSLLKQVCKVMPTFYEAYLGIGIFNYYLSSSLKWLPFVDDNDAKGLECIETAMSANYPFNLAAKNSLCWILVEKKQLKRADTIALSVLNSIPDNTTFLRIRALVAVWNEDYKKAITLGEQLLAITESRAQMNWSDYVSANFVLVKSYEHENMKKECYSCANKILSRTIPQGYKSIPHIKEKMNYIVSVWEKYRVALQ